ncbi:MAG TPA: Rid family hydrolase [Longimicrobiales bacterium]|nr:Rid family hydrolase [Longimicrobiales bacterium]
MMTGAWTAVELGAGFPVPQGAYTPVVRAGEFLFVSGQVPTDPATGRVVGATVAEQTRFVIEKLGRTLFAAGASLSDVVVVNAYLADIGAWDEFNAAYRAGFAPPYPTRTTVGAQLHGVLVELSATAYIGAK